MSEYLKQNILKAFESLGRSVLRTYKFSTATATVDSEFLINFTLEIFVKQIIITMKKNLLGVAVLLLLASCMGNNTTEKGNEDSANIVDSVAKAEIDKTASAEQARPDSIRQDSVVKVEKVEKAEKAEKAEKSKYDDLINQYVSAVNTVEKAAKKGQWNKIQSLCDRAVKLRNKIEKIKKDLTPEQSAKLKKAASKWARLGEGVIAG